jgi:uncharacterized protein YaiE (UPF0345 family)
MTHLMPLFAVPGVAGPKPRYWRPGPANGLLSKILPAALSDFAAQNHLASDWASQTLAKLEDYALTATSRLQEMSPAERQQVGASLGDQQGLSLVGLSDLVPIPGIGIPIPQPNLPIPQPNFPIPQPNFPLPPVPFPPPTPTQVADYAKSVGDSIEQKVVGLAGGVIETVREILTQLPFEIIRDIDAFVGRVTAIGNLLKSGKIDVAIADLVTAVVLLARDIVGTVLAAFVNLVVDFYAGIIGGFLFARPLTQQEKDFACTIFHGYINLTYVQVVVIPGVPGITTANTIYLPGLDLSKVSYRARFAHELTHVYQDQTLTQPGTLHAAGEFFTVPVGSQYDVKLHQGSTWSSLGVEAQAQLVENWQQYKDGDTDAVPADQVTYYKSVLDGEGLF